MSAPFDLIVIGGGVNGAGVARDAAGRGARVLLLEARDLASGTSSASTKLVHGGLRYLEHYEFGLVREALGERETLWRIAPHIVRPLRFVLPVSEGMRPAWMLRAGLFLYDHIGGSGALPGTETIDLRTHEAGAPLKPDLTRGFEYSDGWVDDARLVVLNAMDARERGAEIRTQTPVISARREGDLWRVETPAGIFAGRALVNAGGPGADGVARLAGVQPEFRVRRVRGSHIVVPKLFDHPCAYIFQLPDGRIVFAIPYEDAFTLIGTTDRDHAGSPFEASAAEDEIAYLCEAANRYFTRALTPADVVHSFAGVRALIDDGSGKPEAASRGYHLPLSPPEDGAPLLGIYGGKITSYRALAEEAVDALAERLPALSGPAWTADAPLPGGDFPKDSQGDLIAAVARSYPFLGAAQATRIARAYGTRASRWLGDAASWSELGRGFGAGLSEAEIAYLRGEEWARTAEDVLWRRSKLGLHMSASERAAVQAWMGT
ncbi:MAG: glycerol-3-phosphate dehydrogenase [Sphingomonadales bacterium 32-68-7]|nr:MAG: glycerol-3-phosphate dehydrogenase [Sphingomonadales bacterium 12-68-11]OYX09694.1 MAG: glycerol-3-phosphate dehydrogenase [Sphingomonadales bacterium 32-68-7]